MFQSSCPSTSCCSGWLAWRCVTRRGHSSRYVTLYFPDCKRFFYLLMVMTFVSLFMACVLLYDTVFDRAFPITYCSTLLNLLPMLSGIFFNSFLAVSCFALNRVPLSCTVRCTLQCSVPHVPSHVLLYHVLYYTMHCTMYFCTMYYSTTYCKMYCTIILTANQHHQ